MASTSKKKSSTLVGCSSNMSTSPMELVFSWSETPGRSDALREGGMGKRKCTDDDSGYVTATPCSSSVQHDSGCTSSFEFDDTPYTDTGVPSKRSHQVKSSKQLSFNSASPVKMRAASSYEVDSFLEFVSEASLYTEPMEVGVTLPSLDEEGLQPPLASPEVTEQIMVTPMEVMGQSSPGSRGLWGSASKRLSPRKVSTSRFLSPFEASKQGITPGVEVPLRRSGSLSSKKMVTGGRRISPSFSSFTGSGDGWRRRPRYLCDTETLDLFYQLAVVKNQSLVISKILSYLSDEDVSNATMVSKTWKNICLSDQRTRARWFSYVFDRKQRKENLGVNLNTKGKSTLTPLVNRNHSTPLQCRQVTSPPVSPTKFRFHLFQKEAKKLKSGEVLMQCPCCSLPSTCSPSLQLGQCKRISCQATFCTVCRRQYHQVTPCPGTEPNLTDTPPKRQRSGSSAPSAALASVRNKKRFLRRL